MDISLQYFERIKADILAEKERQIALIKESVLREIQPKCNEIEQLKAEEINRLTIDYNTKKNLAVEQYNNQLVTLQQNFENDKNKIIELTEKRKTDILDNTLKAKTSEITKTFDKAIEDIDILIAKRTKKE